MMAEQAAADEYFLQEETETEALAARYEDEMERKMCQVNVVQPFMDKFESSSYNNIEDSYWKYIDKAHDKMIRSENMQNEKGCHKVGFQSTEEFEKNLNSTRTEQVIEEINTTSDLTRCVKCSYIIVPDACHCHKYFCKKCHSDKVCRVCNKLTVFPEDVFHFQYHLTLKYGYIVFNF